MKTRILLVDDHELTLRALEKLLDFNGYEVTAVGSAVEALAICDTKRFDILVSDIALQDGNGNDLLRGLADKCAIKGIAYTALTGVEDLAEMAKAGFAAYVFKPAKLTALLDAIQRLGNEE